MPSDPPTYDDMLAACIAAFRAVEVHGSQEMRGLARALLHAAGEEAARRLKMDA